MTELPDDGRWDRTLAFLREGYRFIGRRCTRLGGDRFRTRLMMRPALCMRGAEAARVFYVPDRFTRRGALPPTTQFLLQGRGSVQSLDGAAHRHRKQLFLAIAGPEAVAALCGAVREAWRRDLAEGWSRRDRIVLHEAVQAVLCRAVCHWAGVPLDERALRRRTREFASMVEAAAQVGPRAWLAAVRRLRCERWAREVLTQLRSGGHAAPPGSAARRIAEHRELDGHPLALRIAAIELINVLRPTVAVARFVVFAALALHTYPHWRALLRDADETMLDAFVQEVRRFYPFFPAVAGRARVAFEWRGLHVAAGTWCLLDLYGTDHDPHLWREPEAFRPERFLERPAGAFDLVAQGGGTHAEGHRCPGETITLALMKLAVRELVGGMRYRVPPQDLSIDLARLPALPRSGFVIEAVTACAAPAAQPAGPPRQAPRPTAAS